MRRLALLLLAISCGFAHTETLLDCSSGYTARATTRPVDDAFRYFRDLGLKTLLEQVNAGEILVTAQRKAFARQADVSARFSLSGQKKIIVREPDESTANARAEFRWQLAITLFDLQMQPAIWSRRAIAPDDVPLELKGLLTTIPKKWRDQQQARTVNLLHELYTLFDHLAAPSTEDLGNDGLRAEDFMPKFDPGYNWGIRMLWLNDASQSIGPNLTDYERWKAEGRPALASMLGARHDSSVLNNYRMNHFKRLLMVASMVSTLAMVPKIFEIPKAIEAHRATSAQQAELRQAPARADQTKVMDSDYRVRGEFQRQLKALNDLQASATPDDDQIELLKEKLQELIDENPSAFYLGAAL